MNLENKLIVKNVQRFLEFLREEGIYNKIDTSVKRRFASERPNLMNIHSIKEFIYKPIDLSLPDDFLVLYKEKINYLRLEPEVVIRPDMKDQSLYHLTTDRSLLQIIKDGHFKDLSDNNQEGIGTGRFERKLGLKGIFCTYAKVYDCPNPETDNDSNLIVFPKALLDDHSTICLRNELSLSMAFGFGSSTDFDKLDRRYLNLLGLKHLSKKYINNFTSKEFSLYLISGLAYAISFVESSDLCKYNVLKHGRSTPVQSDEVVINDVNKLYPQLIIVKEEPEHFIEQAKACNSRFKDVPFVENNCLELAVSSIGKKLPLEKDSLRYKDQPVNCLRELFVEGVNRGLIDVEQYRAKC